MKALVFQKRSLRSLRALQAERRQRSFCPVTRQGLTGLFLMRLIRARSFIKHFLGAVWIRLFGLSGLLSVSEGSMAKTVICGWCVCLASFPGGMGILIFHTTGQWMRLTGIFHRKRIFQRCLAATYRGTARMRPLLLSVRAMSFCRIIFCATSQRWRLLHISPILRIRKSPLQFLLILSVLAAVLETGFWC